MFMSPASECADSGSPAFHISPCGQVASLRGGCQGAACSIESLGFRASGAVRFRAPARISNVLQDRCVAFLTAMGSTAAAASSMRLWCLTTLIQTRMLVCVAVVTMANFS